MFVFVFSVGVGCAVVVFVPVVVFFSVPAPVLAVVVGAEAAGIVPLEEEVDLDG